MQTMFGVLKLLLVLALLTGTANAQQPYDISEDEAQIKLSTDKLQAVIRKQGYVSGTAAGSLLDKQTGLRDAGFGLDIVDWIMEPGSDEAYRDQLPKEMVYQFGNAYHGQRAKRSIEGPQICTQAKQLAPKIIRGQDFVAIEQSFQYQTAAPGKKAGSTWTQRIVFPVGQRYFISSDRIDAVNDSPAMFLRIDMPGHIKHKQGDSFSEVHLSYFERPIPAKEFLTDFAPDERFNYRRETWEASGKMLPQRMIRGYRLRDPATGKDGPWLLGMTLEPSVVSEAWCHQRGYVCMIEEFGERPIKAGESFSAAFIVGYFDSLTEANKVYDQHRGTTGLTVDSSGWKLN
jgi:hypothetical protein